MTVFTLNGSPKSFQGNPGTTLLDYLRGVERIISVKDGCSGQGACGACTVEVNGLPRLACRTKVGDLEGAAVVTTEGLPEDFRRLIGRMFAEKGAVQCGFCSPGFIMRCRHLFVSARSTGKHPTRKEITQAVQPNICRCTGYVKIVDAIEAAMSRWLAVPAGDVTDSVRDNFVGEQEPGAWQGLTGEAGDARIGGRYVKYQAEQTALGQRRFVADMHVDGMLFGALRFSDHARARVLQIDVSAAAALPGVVKVLTAADVPGARYTGLIYNDWPIMVAVGETTHCVGDVLAGVVADTAAIAREAASLIRIDYTVFDPITDMHIAALPGSSRVHAGRSNQLESCNIRFGDVDKAFAEAAYVSSGIYETQRIEHAFLETEAALAMPDNGGLLLYSQGQGVYVDRRQVAAILGMPEEKLRVVQVQNGGGFGGKEDLTVQGHAAWYAWKLNRPVMVSLSREESIRMHPKRHPVWMDISLACDSYGKLTALRLKAVGDTGAYASVGTKVMERVVGHATGAYVVPSVDITARTIYTNNIPSGAMRGFGVPQVTFAVESCIDDLCRQGGFDRWQIRFDNALTDGATTATGQKLEGVGLKKTLLAVKETFDKARYAGIACGLKNTGVGNGMTDDSEVVIHIVSAKQVVIHHGWTEMGQGVHTMGIQTLYQETGIDPSVVDVVVDTHAALPTGMTTSSRATALVGRAVMDAAQHLKHDIAELTKAGSNLHDALAMLAGRAYRGKFAVDWTCKPGAKVDNPRIHFSYGYATQVVVLDDQGRISRMVAAHDAGRIMNRMLFEGQIEGAVHMGLGYALSEDLPLKNGMPLSLKFKDLGILRAGDMPQLEVIGVEENDPYGPYGAKGIGEIGMVPTAAAVANAFAAYDGQRRFKLPLSRSKVGRMK